MSHTKKMNDGELPEKITTSERKKKCGDSQICNAGPTCKDPRRELGGFYIISGPQLEAALQKAHVCLGDDLRVLSSVEPVATPDMVDVEPSEEGRGQYDDLRELIDRDDVQETQELQTVQSESSNQPDTNEVQVRPLGYIKDPSTRRKRFCARKRTLLEKAKEIHIMCGSTVKFDLKAESGRQYTYHSHPVAQRHVKLQADLNSTVEVEQVSTGTTTVKGQNTDIPEIEIYENEVIPIKQKYTIA
ncbi:uncharacterized protein LOC105443477 [Strongylocentrotus purpuratus]|uniref:MADS-box domain-containing protein n=1 Tax=Strongylocentrotus purpuratus TaxID=7668 RepID=A0A7M7P8N2_STRPU|nr:uncharacterized protein LOC105443477 [Strongylocentrotus purpuratus]